MSIKLVETIVRKWRGDGQKLIPAINYFDF